MEVPRRAGNGGLAAARQRCRFGAGL